MKEVLCKAQIKMSMVARIVCWGIVAIVIAIIDLYPARKRVAGIMKYGFCTYNYNIFGWGIGYKYDDGRMKLESYVIPVLLLLMLIPLIGCFFSYLRLRASKKCNLSLYADKVEGINAGIFSTRNLNFPIAKIDSIMTSRGFSDVFFGGKSIIICTSSGRIRFRAVLNADEFVQKTIDIIENNKMTVVEVAATKSETSMSMDDLKKLKDLMDQGIITEKEFEEKKKQILGL